MPNYGFFCKGCYNEFSIMASMEDKAEHRIPCPECGSTDLVPIYKAAPTYIKSTGEKVVDCPNSSRCGGTCPYSCGS